ncbi:ABC transporter substrate-binding protein [Pseudonocardia sp.]|uniref:ABC transporter substrate-binding protein n=1 Tax=Pseudonocardia sp. TaxID=60912 RepID=UPI0026120D96|nr:ABC transporter substrate-binding protein [Pseudonocardia sp.]
MDRVRRITRLAAAVLSAAVLAACGAPPTQAPSAGAPAGPLRIATSFTIDSMDPIQEGFWMPEFGVAETPMRVTPDGELEPWLIAGLDRSDERTWVLTLRPDVTFQNGTPLDAAAFAASMTRQLIESPSAQAQLAGATAAASGELEVTLTTPTPDASVPHALANEAVFAIYDSATVQAAGEDVASLVGAGIYTGPYAVRALDEQRVELDAFAGHWAGPPPLPGVTVRFVADAQARILAVQNGETDLALYVPTDAKQVLEGDPSAVFVTPERGTGTATLMINLQREPFADPAARRALSLGIDYAQIATEVLDGAYDVAQSLYSTVHDFAVPNQRTDTAAATALLDGAGWLPGADGVRAKDGTPLRMVLLTYPQQPDTQTMAIAVQSQLAPLGFAVQIRQVEDVNAALADDPDWDAAVVFNGTAGFTGSPEPFLRRYLVTGGDRNYGGVADPELDELTARLGATFDEAARADLLARIQEIVITERTYLGVLAVKRFPVVAAPEWAGYEPSNSLNHVTADTRPGA